MKFILALVLVGSVFASEYRSYDHFAHQREFHIRMERIHDRQDERRDVIIVQRERVVEQRPTTPVVPIIAGLILIDIIAHNR